ncbi:hypothetical protein ABT169_20750 [Streptomyces sp. NPDC001616]|uniref:hypothetical protein n=1 Tax=Streptomyces sp. NPDC001616 TaxID=3156648 RepID=UPI003327DFD8
MSDGLSPEVNTYPPELLNVIGDLLATAHRQQIGVAFEPDGDGWRLHYLVNDWPAVEEYELSARALSDAYDFRSQRLQPCAPGQDGQLCDTAFQPTAEHR